MTSKGKRGGKQLFISSNRPGKRFNNNLFSIEVIKLTSSTQPSKFAVVINKKTVASAVARNLLKRRIYHILSNQNIKMGVGVIIFTKPLIALINNQQLNESLQSLLAAAGVYNQTYA